MRVLDLVVVDGDAWRVDEARVGNVSMIPWRTGDRATTARELSRLLRRAELAPCVVQVAQDLSLRLEYAGPLAASALVAAAVGCAPRRLPPVEPGSRASRRAESPSPVLASRPAQASVSLTSPGHASATASLVEAISVEDPDCWVVQDVRLDDLSWPVRAGEFPAGVLSVLRDLDLPLGIARHSVEVRAAYAGPADEARTLRIEVLTSRLAEADDPGQ